MHLPMNEESEKEIAMKLSAMLPPAAPSPKPIRCAECGAKNSAQRKFCGKCGNHLWDPCLRCGEPNPSHEEFCGNCGVHLQTALQEKLAAAEADLETAGILLEDYRFHEALGLLKPVAAAAHSRLAKTAGQAKALLLQCSAEQTDWIAKIRALEEKIPGSVAAGDIDSALRRIREIPEVLRSPELREISENLAKQRAEIAELERIVAQSGDRPLTVELMEKVVRLLELRPNHRGASERSLALKGSAMRQAKTFARKDEFENAWEIINCVPEAFRDEQFRAFRERIGDLAYLARDVGHAPLVDKSLFEFGRRLHKYLPEDSELKFACKKLADREKDFRQSAFADRRWSASRPSPLFGAPLEFLCDLGAIRIGECAGAAALAENSGRFAVACGLALQGLELAPLKFNLLPEDSWRGKSAAGSPSANRGRPGASKSEPAESRP